MAFKVDPTIRQNVNTPKLPVAVRNKTGIMIFTDQITHFMVGRESIPHIRVQQKRSILWHSASKTQKV